MTNTSTALPITNLTLVDWAKRQDPNGKIPIIAEFLSQTNEILQDAVFKEANTETGERVIIRTVPPKAYWRAPSQGIPSNTGTATVLESYGTLEAHSSVDVAEFNGNVAQFRSSEDMAFWESMGQTQAQTLFYGNPNEEEGKGFPGFAFRYSDMKAVNGENIIDAGGRGSKNTSVYLVVWGDQTVYCIFPKGSTAGLTQQDQDEDGATGENSGKFRAETWYQWKNGLVVKDWRYVVRIANIDVNDLAEQKGTQAPGAPTELINLLSDAVYQIPHLSAGRPAFYMNRSVHEGLVISALDKSQNVVTVEKGLMQFGSPHSWVSFLGVPLRCTDVLLNNEEVVR